MLVLTGLNLPCNSSNKADGLTDTSINQSWWDSLSEEWKTILLINQNFSKQGTDIYLIQNEYIHRMHSADDERYTELNTSLHDLANMRQFMLGYQDFYNRALRYNHCVHNDKIDLSTLGELESIYMVNGPDDLSPLKYFPKLKTLILNGCGINPNIPINHMSLDIEPLKYLKELEVLHCSSLALRSIKPIENLLNLRELKINNTSITDVSPIKKLVNLEVLYIGSKVKKAKEISRLVNLEELYLDGLQTLPNFSKLKNLKKLSIAEHEFALVNDKYRIKDLFFINGLSNLEILDFENTSYRGNLEPLYGFKKLKAISLPRVNSMSKKAFEEVNKDCIIINAVAFF